MKLVGPCYEKLFKEFIVNITAECNVEGYKEYRKVCDRGKCVKLSPPIFNNHLGRRKVTYINNIMTKEEEEIASEDEEEYYVEVLKYNEIMELHSEAQLLETMLIARACYPSLMKDIKVKNEDIPHGFLNFSFKLNVGKDVSNIVSNICAPVNETDLVFDGEMLELFHLNQLILLLLFWCSFYDCGLVFLFYGTCSLLEVFWLKIYASLISYYSCQVFVLDPKSYCFVYSHIYVFCLI